MKYRAIIFDLDDTLFDRQAAQRRTVDLIMERLPHIFLQCSRAAVEEAFLESDRLVTVEYDAGAPSEGLRDKRSRIFLRLLGINEDYADIITEMYVEDYPNINIPVEGATPLVKEIIKKAPAAIITNGLPDVQYKKLEALGLGNVFSCIILSEEIGIRKPDHRIFHRAAEILNVPPADCLYIGDSYPTDIVGAKGAGMATCWLNRNPVEADINGEQADFVINNLGELKEILGL